MPEFKFLKSITELLVSENNKLPVDENTLVIKVSEFLRLRFKIPVVGFGKISISELFIKEVLTEVGAAPN